MNAFRKPSGPPLLLSLGISPDQISAILHQGLMLAAPGGEIEYVNATFCDVTGYSPAEVLGKNSRILQSGKQPPQFYTRMWKSIVETGCWQGEIQNRRKNGQLYTEWLTISALKDSAGAVTHYVGIFTDISKRKEAERSTWKKANHDILTGLSNRSLFAALLKQGLAQTKRNRSILAVMFLDLDHLKAINDTFGHIAGDRLLCEMVARIRQSIREADVLGRFGGDEFVLMMPNVKSREDVARVGQKILSSIRGPLHLGDQKLLVTASIGVSIFPEDGTDVEELIERADSAMYIAKKRGRDRVRFYSTPSAANASHRAVARAV